MPGTNRRMGKSCRWLLEESWRERAGFPEIGKPPGGGFQQLCLVVVRDEVWVCAVSEDDIGSSPGLVVDQPPFMAGAGGVHRDEDVTGPEGEGLATTGSKFECTRKGDDILRVGCVVPVEGGMRGGFFELDGLGFDERRIRDLTTNHVGVAVRTGIEM